MLKGKSDLKDYIYNLNIYALILDGLIAFVIIYNIVKAAKLGFISSLISLILTIVMWIFIWPFSGWISNHVYNLYVRDWLAKVIESKLINKGLENVMEFINLFQQRLPNLSRYSEDNLSEVSNIDSIGQISFIISDKIVYPLFNILVCVIILIVSSFLFSIIIKILKNLFSKFSYIPFWGHFNMILGGIFGFFKSIIFIIFISIIINSLIFFSNDRWNFLNSNVRNESFLLSLYDRFINLESNFNVFNIK